MIEFMQAVEEPDAAPPENENIAPDPHLMMLPLASINPTVTAPRSMQLQVTI